MPRFRLSYCRSFLYLVIGLAVFELFFLNIVVLYTYFALKQEFSAVFSESDTQGVTIVDKLMQSPILRNLVYKGKSGGFLSLLQETVERVYVVSGPPDSQKSSPFGGREVSFLGLDVSSAGEATYLFRRIASRGQDFSDKYHRIIIDIGANDGLMSSNSFNFIQWGWNAILVEPQLSLLRQARQNLERYTDPFNEKQQRVILVNAMIGPKDGMEDFVLLSDDMQSHRLDPNWVEEEQGPNYKGQLIVKVPSLTVATFARKHSVPVNFGILSIDAEGVGDVILHQWLDGGFRPAYILYEQLHNKEPITITAHYLRHKGYRFLTRLGWNYIYEHSSHDGSNDS